MEQITLKVKGDTDVGLLAGSISKNLAEGKKVEAVAIGASAVNQLVKAIATAEGHAGSAGRVLRYRHGFSTVPVRNREDGTVQDRTAIVTRFAIE